MSALTLLNNLCSAGRGAFGGVGFAIPVDQVKGLVQQILTYGKVQALASLAAIMCSMQVPVSTALGFITQTWLQLQRCRCPQGVLSTC